MPDLMGVAERMSARHTWTESMAPSPAGCLCGLRQGTSIQGTGMEVEVTYTRVSATPQPLLEGSPTHKPLETYPPVRCQAGNLSFSWPLPLFPQGEPKVILLSKQLGHSPMSRMATCLTQGSSTFHLIGPRPLPSGLPASHLPPVPSLFHTQPSHLPPFLVCRSNVALPPDPFQGC